MRAAVAASGYSNVVGPAPHDSGDFQRRPGCPHRPVTALQKLRTTCSSFGIGCHRAVTFRRQSNGLRSRSVRVVQGRWEFQRSQTGLRRGVVKAGLEPELERHFHPDSYGYRPDKSALEAVGVARQRCWRYDWVLDLDIRALFDTIPQDLLLRAARKHTDCPWVLLTISG